MTIFDRFRIGVLALALSLPAAWAQPPLPGQNPSAPPMPSPSTQEGTEQAAEDSSATAAPDIRSFSAVEELAVGSRRRSRSYFLPSFQLSMTGDSNSVLQTNGTSQVETAEIAVGRLAFQRVGRHSRLMTDYVGGGLIYNRHPELNSTYHQIGISQMLRGRRWALLLTDRASYLPESSFGFGGFGIAGGPSWELGGGLGTNLGYLNPNLTPNQSIISGRGSRISNVVIGELQYTPSRRSTITAAASYALLKFKESGFIDSNHRVFQGGYTYALSRSDTLAVLYGYGLFRFEGSNVAIDTHSIQLGYARRISGRLAVQLAAGPELGIFRTVTGSTVRRNSWNAHGAIRYRWERSDFGVSYGRFTSSGSGLLVGSQSDNVTLNWGWQMGRRWYGSISPGYAHNRQLRETATAGTQAIFNSWYSGFNLRRSLGRYMDLSFNYSFQQQQSREATVAVVSEGRPFHRHVFSVGFSWYRRQRGIE